MMKKLFLLFIFATMAAVLSSNITFASKSNQIDDSVFYNYSSMSEAQIASWIAGNFPNSCLLPQNYPAEYNNPDGKWRTVTFKEPLSYFTYGGETSAARIIWKASQFYNLNPQVIITTLEKESDLVSGSKGCSTWRYNSAMGYNCPTGAEEFLKDYPNIGIYDTCVQTESYAGFSPQVNKAAWQLSFDGKRANGDLSWMGDGSVCYYGRMTQGNRARVQTAYKSNCPAGYDVANYYDGWYTISGEAVHMDNGPTAALYNYTPFFSRFETIFTGWFGSTQGKPYNWELVSSNAYMDSGRTAPHRAGFIDLNPGETAYITIRARNTGSQAWPQDVVHLGTSYQRDRASSFFNNSWLSANRIQMQEASVAINGEASFTFSLTAPNTTGTYVEHFSLVADGITWFNDPDLYYTINVTTPVQPTNSQNTNLSAGQHLVPGGRLLSPDSQSVFSLLPNGSVSLFVDFKSVWNNGIANNDAQSLVLQSDGNLVEYNNTGQPIWWTGTSGNGNVLAMQTDGNLVMYNNSNPIWSTNTASSPNHLNKTNISLPAGGVMFPNQFIQTADRKYTLVLQSDGNLVEYNNTGQPIWWTGTSGNGNVLAMQTDGNLVMYGTNGKALWWTSTGGGGNSLTLQPSGAVVITNGHNSIIWGNQFIRAGQYIQTTDRAYTLVLQASDGNLVEYDSNGRAVWASGTSGSGNILVLQRDGNLVIYNKSGRPIWASGTSGSGNAMVLQNDGNMVIYNAGGRAVWALR